MKITEIVVEEAKGLCASTSDGKVMDKMNKIEEGLVREEEPVQTQVKVEVTLVKTEPLNQGVMMTDLMDVTVTGQELVEDLKMLRVMLEKGKREFARSRRAEQETGAPAQAHGN